MALWDKPVLPAGLENSLTVSLLPMPAEIEEMKPTSFCKNH